LETFTSRPDETFFQNVFNLIEKTKLHIRQRKNTLAKKQKDRTTNERRRSTVAPKGSKGKLLVRKLKKKSMTEDHSNTIHLTVFKSTFYQDVQEDYPSMYRVFVLLQLMCQSNSNVFKVLQIFISIYQIFFFRIMQEHKQITMNHLILLKNWFHS
jgi:hypothetical protein